jgi:hypothetical protein
VYLTYDRYQTLKRKGLSHQYESEGEPIRPILDHEIAAAIESLRNSTTAIEQQCRVLEAQRDALMKLKALDKPNLDVEHARNERRRKEGQEKARLGVAIDDVSTAITEQLTDARREVDSEKSALKSYVAERLSSDDQILSRLPNIVSTIVTEAEVSEDERSVEQWCTAIISFRTAEIKARVDAVYLNSLSEKTNGRLPTGTEAELQQRKDALQAEMEELHAEVASIAEMVVEHELRKPMIDVKERKEKERALARTAWLNYVCVDSLLESSPRLTISGSLDTRLHGQAPRHRQYFFYRRGRVPPGYSACQRGSFEAHARCTCSAAYTCQETHIICASISIHTNDEAQANGISGAPHSASRCTSSRWDLFPRLGYLGRTPGHAYPSAS